MKQAVMRHRFHALCPYFAMFPESFVETWIDRLTKPGDLVLDPFCGRGTTPFQALLMGRKAIACDISPVAYCVTKAKTNAPSRGALMRRITFLENQYASERWEQERLKLPEFFRWAYSAATLRQLLYLRASLAWAASKIDCMIAALVLGSLHGETLKSDSYFSNQMPHTISTKPQYSIRYWQERGLMPPERDAFELLRQRASYRYKSASPQADATVFLSDFRELPKLLAQPSHRPRCIITSPPYFDVTNIEEDQWLRLWFLGGPPGLKKGNQSGDYRHATRTAFWDFISDIWRSLSRVAGDKTDVVIRLGGKSLDPNEIVQGLKATSVFTRRKVSLLHHEVSILKNRQTNSFRPGSKGLAFEVDCHFLMK
jgi:hypothetical protein